MSPEVARLPGIRSSPGAGRFRLRFETSGIRITGPTRGLRPGTPVLWSIRPERVMRSSKVEELERDPLAEVLSIIGTAMELYCRPAPGGFEMQIRTTQPLQIPGSAELV